MYRVVEKSSLFCFSSQSCVLQFFFHIFQVVYTAGLGDSFDTNMDPTGRYTTQQRIKIIEAYFATKSVLLTQWQCRRDLGRNNIPDRSIVQRLVDKFRKIENVADAHKDRHRSSFGVIPENIQNFRQRLEESPRKSTRCLSQETVISRTSVLRILHDDVKLFPFKTQILRRQTDQNKAEGETFCEDIRQTIENDPGLLDLNDLNNVDHCGLCETSATLSVSRNLSIKRWIVLLSGTLFFSKSLLHFRCVRRTDFVAKYASMIFIGCCVVNSLVGSILVSKESARSAVYTTWEIWKKL